MKLKQKNAIKNKLTKVIIEQSVYDMMFFRLVGLTGQIPEWISMHEYFVNAI